jgi:hypothetical protein
MRLRWSAAPDGLSHGEPHQRSGVSPSAHAPGDWPEGCSGPADAVPDGHPEDDAGHRDPGGRDGESKRLRMVADGSLLGHPISGGSSLSAVGDDQGAHHQQEGHAQDGRLEMEDAEAQRWARDLRAADCSQAGHPGPADQGSTGPGDGIQEVCSWEHRGRTCTSKDPARIKKYLNERQGEGGENLILERAGEVELPAAGGGSGLLS